MHFTALVIPTLVGLASAVSIPLAGDLVPNSSGLQRRGWNHAQSFPAFVGPFTAWKHVGCYSTDVALTFDTGICSCSNNAVNKVFTMEKCFALCKGAGFRYAGIKGANGAKHCWCGSGVRDDDKLSSTSRCDAPCGEGEGDTTKEYATNQCGGKNAYSVWKDPCYKSKWDADEAAMGYRSVGCFSGAGGWVLSTHMKSVSGDNLSIDSCVEACARDGYAYAGPTNGWDCYCGGRIAPHFADLHMKNPGHNNWCTKLCSATAKVQWSIPKEEYQYCGNAGYYSIYFNPDLAETEKCTGDVEKVTQIITVTKDRGEPKEATQSYDKDKTTRVFTTVTAPAKVTQTVTVTANADPPTEDDEEYDEDKTTRVRKTITVKADKVTQTVTVTAGAEPPTEDDEEYDEDKTTRVRKTITLKVKPNKTTKTTQTITVTKGQPLPEEADEDYDEDKTTRVTVTVTAKRQRLTTTTITVTKGTPLPKEVTRKIDTKRYTIVIITVPAKRLSTQTVTYTVGKKRPNPGEYNTNKITRVTVTVTAGKPIGKVTKTVTVTEGEDEPEPTEPAEGEVIKTVTVKPTKTGDGEPEETGEPEEGEETKKPSSTKPATATKETDGEPEETEKPDPNPGGKGGEPDEPKEGEETKKPSSTKPATATKETDGEPEETDKPDPNPGGKGTQPDTLCAMPVLSSAVKKKWADAKYPLAGIKAPAVSCHDDKSKHKAGYHFKLYVGPNTPWPKADCRIDYVHKPEDIQSACWNACIEQRKDCLKSAAVKKMSKYTELCQAQHDACRDANDKSKAPAVIQKINDEYCKKPAPPFPKPGGKDADPEDIDYF
ncbi:hypothetical protein TWF730_000575 [Orbilia blumenaviensis]|uniref:WSC domain-containing protein n=1 Tax=Orbilia blumenaviensis TaxID=1796055 RepID=A0AAV9VN82_9PEZI